MTSRKLCLASRRALFVSALWSTVLSPVTQALELTDNLRLDQKITGQLGLGPTDIVLGEDHEVFYSLRYTPTFLWRNTTSGWPDWEFFTRFWFTYSSSTVTDSVFDQEGSNQEGASAEWREFYVTKNVLFGNPLLSIDIGRMTFEDRFGLWWDDTLMAVRLNLTDATKQGFIAAGWQDKRYNTKISDYSPGETDITYIFGDYSWQYQAHHWVGARFMVEQDNSNHNDVTDSSDYDGNRLGLFISGEWRSARAIKDYHLELVTLDGTREFNNGNGPETEQAVSGWAVLGEAGYRFKQRKWKPRLALRLGVTDTPDDTSDGFFKNNIQSDRVIPEDSYNSSLASSIINLNFSNMTFYALMLETKPSFRTWLDFRLYDLYLNNDKIDSRETLPIANIVVRDQPPEGKLAGKNIGQVFEVTHYWRLYPWAIRKTQVHFSTLARISYFNAGDTDFGFDDDYRLSVGIEAKF